MVTGAGWRGRGVTFQLQRSHREKSLPGRGAASSHVGPGAGSASRGWWGVSPGPYRPGLRSPGVRAGGVRLSRPRCLMAVTGVVAPPSPPRGGGSRKAQAWPRRRQGQVRPAVQTPLPSAVPRLGPCSSRTAPLQGQRPGGALCLADVQGQMPSTDTTFEARLRRLDFRRWGTAPGARQIRIPGPTQGPLRVAGPDPGWPLWAAPLGIRAAG